MIVLQGGRGFGYRYLLPELRDAIGDLGQVVFYDQRASGQSTGGNVEELLTFSQFLDDLGMVMDFFELPNAILLGHSFGGLLAMQFAIQKPSRVAGLILADSDPGKPWFVHTVHLPKLFFMDIVTPAIQ
jgi:proline iminopeptidase